MTLEQLRNIQTGRRYYPVARELPQFNDTPLFVAGQSCSVQKIFDCQQQGLPIPVSPNHSEFSSESFRIDEDITELHDRITDFKRQVKAALQTKKQKQQEETTN